MSLRKRVETVLSKIEALQSIDDGTLPNLESIKQELVFWLMEHR